MEKIGVTQPRYITRLAHSVSFVANLEFFLLPRRIAAITGNSNLVPKLVKYRSLN